MTREVVIRLVKGVGGKVGFYGKIRDLNVPSVRKAGNVGGGRFWYYLNVTRGQVVGRLA